MEYCKFLEDYRLFSQGNETPELMHLWCGLLTLAGAAEKRIWLDQEYFNLYLNLYILLIAPAGVASKSTSMGMASKLLKGAGFNILEGSVLKEKIIEDMEATAKPITHSGETFNHSSITYISNELNVLLNSGVDMVKFLVDIYDREESYVYKTKKSGQYEVPYPFFNMIAAAVPQWFGDYVCSDMGSTGFLARCIVVYEEQKRGSYPKPVYTDKQKAARQRCLEHIEKMGQLVGKLVMDDEADKAFCDWYNSQKPNPSTDYRINSYYERRNKIHILKIAGLMALGDMRMTITKIDFDRALDILSRTEKKMRLAYVIASSNKLAPYIHQVLNLLDEHGGKIKSKELVRLFIQEMDNEEIKRLVSTLEDMDAAKRYRDKEGSWIIKT